jgi:hypothetical protein
MEIRMEKKRSKTDIDCNNLFITKYLSPIKHPLFHYTSETSSQSIQKSKELWMTYYKMLNDQKEFSHGLENIISYLTVESEKHNDFRDYYKGFLDFLHKEKETPLMHIYIMCFCKRKSNAYLARNYHKGQKLCLVEFDFHVSDIGIDPVCLNVLYSTRRFKKHAKNLFLRYAYYHADHEKDQGFELDTFFSSLVKDVFILALSLKHHKYANEEEIRLVKFDLHRQKKLLVKKNEK